MKKAIVAVTFGIGDIKVKERCIDTILADLRESFPEYSILEAWTSNFLRRKMAKAGYDYPTLEAVLDDLAAQGCEEVALMPTHLTPGEEFQNKILPMKEQYGDKFAKFTIMSPIFTVEKMEDYAFLTEDVLSLSELADDEVMVFMGHGSPHQHNAAYELLQQFADAKGWPVHIGVVEPEDYPNQADVLQRLEEYGCKKIYLRPLLLAGGNHATHDLAGDEPESWKSVLSNAGFEVRYSIIGLGEYPAYRRLYINKLQKMLENE